ncbi:hypothetical protein DXB06_11275 [Butyricicoccus sp. OF13-6]|nr:hypothetical protein [Butyricicoccus sp. OF13-6]RHV72918.1 hypothetical protein DXB06_11275 [Butyricicoccus sp. OF13-6]
MSRQFELNKVLFEAVTACNYEEAERLLNLGADPLGSTNETDADEHLLGELFFAMQDNEDWVAAFPKFLELFYAHGMDIAARNILRMTETTSTRFGCWPYAEQNSD